MNTKLLILSLLPLMCATSCQDDTENSISDLQESAIVSFDLKTNVSVSDEELTRATPSLDYYYIAVSPAAASDGKISSGYVGYFTSLSNATLSLKKGVEYHFYVSGYIALDYSFDWSSSGLTANEFTAISSASDCAPAFADLKVDRYYGDTNQTINGNTTISVTGNRFVYAIKVNIESPLEGKVVLTSSSPELSYTVKSTDASIENATTIFSLAGQDEATAKKNVSISIKFYNKDEEVVDSQTKSFEVARLRTKVVTVKAINPTTGFSFDVSEEALSDDENEIVINPGSSSQHEYVDMGFHDKNDKTLYWATCNIGAQNPQDAGHYFAWGEVQGYPSNSEHSFDWTNYSYYSVASSSTTKYNTTDNIKVLDSSDDAASQLWGGSWRLPTKDELSYLINSSNCTWKQVTLGGVTCYEVESLINQNKIYLPLAGRVTGDGFDDASENVTGYYWSRNRETSNKAYYLEITTAAETQSDDRCLGFSIRPVFSAE